LIVINMNSIVGGVGSDGKSLTVALVNPTQEPQSLNLHLESVQFAGGAQMWQTTASCPDAANVLDKQPGVAITEKALSPEAETVSIAPASITVFDFRQQTFQLLPYIEGRSALNYISVPE
jgi:alpha-N-arabinofuranosidase